MNLAESPDAEADAQAVDTLQPLVDDALAALPGSDRDALLLRYFGRKSLGEIGLALGLSDDAAQKRVSRALEKLRDHFRSHGIVVSAGTVAAAVSVAGAETPPVWISAGIAAAAVSGAAGTVAAASWIAPIALMKAPLAYVAAAALALTAGWQARSLSGLRQENAALRVRLDDAEARAAAKPVPVRAETAPDAEVLRLRAKVAELTRLQKAAARPVVAAPASAAPVAEIQPSESEIEEYTQRRMNIVNGGKTLGLAARIFASAAAGP
jgi:hypothetical protein